MTQTTLQINKAEDHVALTWNPDEEQEYTIALSHEAFDAFALALAEAAALPVGAVTMYGFDVDDAEEGDNGPSD